MKKHRVELGMEINRSFTSNSMTTKRLFEDVAFEQISGEICVKLEKGLYKNLSQSNSDRERTVQRPQHLGTSVVSSRISSQASVAGSGCEGKRGTVDEGRLCIGLISPRKSFRLFVFV